MVLAAAEALLPGRYEIDPTASTISFETRHFFGLAPVRGTFTLEAGHIDLKRGVLSSTAELTVSAASFRTGSNKRDKSVRGQRYLGAVQYPAIDVQVAGLRISNDQLLAAGTLTVRGTAAPFEATVEAIRTQDDRVRTTMRAEIDRLAYGITARRGLVGRRLSFVAELVARRRGR